MVGQLAQPRTKLVGVGAVSELDYPASNAAADLEAVTGWNHEASAALGDGAGLGEGFGGRHGQMKSRARQSAAVICTAATMVLVMAGCLWFVSTRQL